MCQFKKRFLIANLVLMFHMSFAYGNAITNNNDLTLYSCPNVEDIVCEVTKIDGQYQETCLQKGHKSGVNGFWGGIAKGESPKDLDNPIYPSDFKQVDWAINPASPTDNELNPISTSFGNILCFYNTLVPNVHIVMLTLSALPYVNITAPTLWVSDKYDNYNSMLWDDPFHPTNKNVITKNFICRGTVNACKFTLTNNSQSNTVSNSFIPNI